MEEERLRSDTEFQGKEIKEDESYRTAARQEFPSVERSVPLSPGWLIPLSLVSGLTVSGIAAGIILHKCGRPKGGWAVGIGSGLLGLLLFAFAFMWRVEWYWASLVLSGTHVASGVGLFFMAKGPHRKFRERHGESARIRGGYRQILAGIAGGAILACLLGTVTAILYVLTIDWVLSTLMPVAFDDAFSSIKTAILIAFMTISGSVAGGFIGRFKPRIGAVGMIGCSLALLWNYFTWFAALEMAIAVPGFQAGSATGMGWMALAAPFIQFNLLLGFWWPVFLLLIIVGIPGLRAKLARAMWVPLVNLAAGITLSITFGYSADTFLALGKHFERNAHLANAVWCYEHGLSKKPKRYIASYLQYRVSLLNHKLGNEKAAREGFGRVVATFTDNEELVKKASRFLENLERTAGKKRVVLPGVETRTEYKGGYCVPNSLALVMRYWGSEVTARSIGAKITGIGTGTHIVNQAWFAQQEGFHHDFLPLADLNDIKDCIDAGFPVLVYVPAHVFAIVGYDEALETFVTYDVATQDVWVEYLQKDFIKAWKKEATTLVLAYPPEKEGAIPPDIHARLTRLSDEYLHFQLHLLDVPAGSVSIPHLLKASGERGELFFPVTMLYSGFPGMRGYLAEKFDTAFVAEGIRNYFRNDFDEGLHLAGQRHDMDSARNDLPLKAGVEYLASHHLYDAVEDIIERIDTEGRLSKDMLGEAGVIDLARGELERGLNRLEESGKKTKALYAGLAQLKLGNEQGAIRELVKTVEREV